MTGPILLFGSGETSPSGRKAFDLALSYVMEYNEVETGQKSNSPEIAMLETPAGFELNSYMVIRRVAEFVEHRLENYHPHTTIVRARKRGTDLSPDNPEIASTILPADIVFLGPGSPTYAVRQLKDSLSWKTALYRHRQGAALALASAAAIAVSAHAIPVYEIYKVGEDPFWKPGLDLFGPAGLELVFVPHWNNNDGGEELDTSRCFMGQERFDLLKGMLPTTAVIIGIDEKTILWIDPSEDCCRVIGSGTITVIKGSSEETHHQDSTFSLEDLGPYKSPELISKEEISELASYLDQGPAEPDQPTQAVLDLVERRQEARSSKDWAAADKIRAELAGLGWQVEDTPEGPRILKI
jgi:hypothetical protein